MVIKTCEEYVLTLLKSKEEELDRLQDYVIEQSKEIKRLRNIIKGYECDDINRKLLEKEK